MRQKPSAGELYRHFKNKIYQIITVAKHSETGEELVIYQALYGTYETYARPLSMFMSEVDHEKYPEVEQKYRFEKIDRTSLADVNTNNRKIETQANDNVYIKPKNAENDTNIEQVDEGADPNLLAFLDTESYADKYRMVCDMRNDMTDRLINDLAVVLDIVIEEGPLDKRYEQLKSALATFAKFEVNRLR